MKNLREEEERKVEKKGKEWKISEEKERKREEIKRKVEKWKRRKEVND